MVAVTTEGDAKQAGKRHDHVMRDIRVMLVELHGEEGIPKFGGVYQIEIAGIPAIHSKQGLGTGGNGQTYAASVLIREA